MTIKETIIAIGVIALSVAIGVGFTSGVASLVNVPQQVAKFGSNSDNYLQTYPAVTKVFVGSTDTLVVATSTGRQYLEIQNASGATTTAQVVSCNFGDRPATLYTGWQLFGSTSKAYALDNLYRGAIHCIAPASGALITVTDF
jgi:hypothetical protein